MVPQPQWSENKRLQKYKNILGVNEVFNKRKVSWGKKYVTVCNSPKGQHLITNEIFIGAESITIDE